MCVGVDEAAHVSALLSGPGWVCVSNVVCVLLSFFYYYSHLIV